mgnify:CR=1 FL=1
MEYMGCKDAAFDVIDEASEKFGELYFINEEKYAQLEEICGLVDEVVQIFDDEFGCDAVTVDVDPTTKELIFNIVCNEVILQHGRAHKFFALAQLVDSIHFSKAKPDSLRIEIGVSKLWLGGFAYE